MSAFLVSDATRAVIVAAARRFHVPMPWTGHPGTDQEWADLLYVENIRALNARYGEQARADGPTDPPPVPALHLAAHVTVPQLAAIIKACQCYQYQIAETDDYRDTPAYRLADAVISATIHALPGYEDAPWDTTDSDLAALQDGTAS